MSCLKCGECCKWLTFTIPGVCRNKVLKEYYLKHGCKFKGNLLLVPMRCPQLNEDNTCKIYEDRPLLCRAFKGQSKSSTSDYFVPDCCGYKK